MDTNAHDYLWCAIRYDAINHHGGDEPMIPHKVKANGEMRPKNISVFQQTNGLKQKQTADAESNTHSRSAGAMCSCSSTEK